MIPFGLPAWTAPAPPATPTAPLRAQYSWGYADAHGEGRGTLSLLLEPSSGRLVLELHGLGERLLLLEGDRSAGYRVQIPRRELDRHAPTLLGLPLPFLPALQDAEGLLRLLRTGEGPGVKVTRRDGEGPVRLRYRGADEQGREVHVWLERKHWEWLSPPT